MRISNLTQFNRLQASLRELNGGLAQAEQQISTGKRSTTFSGLSGENARVSIELRTAISTRETYINNISAKILLRKSFLSRIVVKEWRSAIKNKLSFFMSFESSIAGIIAPKRFPK